MSDTLYYLKVYQKCLMEMPIDSLSKYYPMWRQMVDGIKQDIEKIELETGKPVHFPEDFEEETNHPLDKDSKCWYIRDYGTDDPLIGIFGGGLCIKGDGVETYELYDYRTDESFEYVTQDDIDLYLIRKPVRR